MVAGDAVNTASRVQSAAAPGQVWVDETTRLLTSSAISYVDAGSHQLKGKAEPMALWSARAVVAASVGPSVPTASRRRWWAGPRAAAGQGAVPPLAQTFADRVYSLSPSVKFSSEALALLERYNWPGNIRELENAVVRAVAMCDGTIRVKDLPQRFHNHSIQQGEQANSKATPAPEPAIEDWVTLSEIEGRYVARVLEHTGGNKQAAARVLAVDRKTLDRMIKRHHINSPHSRGHRVKVSGHA